jgi:O-antigen/teichoic acid export membrane protein
VGNIFNIAANYILVKQFGIVGAATASLVTLSLITLWMLMYFKKVAFKPWYGTLLKITLAALGMIVSIILLKTIHIPVVMNVIISGILYVLILILLKEKITEEYLVKTISSLT